MSGSIDIHILIFDGFCQIAFKMFSQFTPFPNGNAFPYHLTNIKHYPSLKVFCQSDRWKYIFAVLICISSLFWALRFFFYFFLSDFLIQVYTFIVLLFFFFYWVVESSLYINTINLYYVINVEHVFPQFVICTSVLFILSFALQKS